MPALEQQALISAVVDGQALGVFNTRQGGDNVATAVKNRPGGMGPEKAYMALPVIADVTISRVAENERDWALMATLQAKAGRVAGSVTEQALDADGNAYGSPVTWQGIFLGLKWGNVDSNSTTARLYELSFAITGIA